MNLCLLAQDAANIKRSTSESILGLEGLKYGLIYQAYLGNESDIRASFPVTVN